MKVRNFSARLSLPGSASDSMAMAREANDAESETVYCREAMSIQKPARLNFSRFAFESRM